MKKIVSLAVSFALLFGLLVCFVGCGKKCDYCKGRTDWTCIGCKGSGEVSMPRLDPKYGLTGEVTYYKCSTCLGTGKQKCPRCGAGRR